VRVFCDRFRRSVAAEREPYKMGHVLAHKITHVLGGTNFHAVSGALKAVWDFGEVPPDGGAPACVHGH